MKLKVLFLLILLPTLCYLPAETITFKADKMSGNAGKETDYTKLIGNAKIDTDSLNLTADSIELNGKDFRFITANGNISGTSKEGGFTFTCDQLKFDRTTKIAILEGNVTMDDSKNSVIATAQYIEYNQETDIAIMQINISLKQKENTCTASLAIYKKDAQVLELTGNPQIKKDKDIFRAQEIIFNLDTEEITLDGKVSGTVVDTGNDNTQEKSTSTSNESTNTVNNTPATDKTVSSDGEKTNE